MFNIFGGVYTPLIKFGLVASLMAALYGTYRYQLSEAYDKGVETTKISYEAQIMAQNEVLNLKKKSTEKNLEIEFAKRQGEANEKIRNLNTTVSNLIAGLQSRPTREYASSNPASADSAESTRGAYPSELYREDAKNLIDLARDAEEIRLSLIQCYADYDAVKQSIGYFPTK